jgi:hypothetical protein
MSTTVAITVPVPSRRTILLSMVVILLLGGVVWAVAAHAASTTASNAGIATVAKGKKVVTVPAGMDLNAESKAQATAMTASTVGVRSVVANAATDKLTITMTGKAKKAIRVSWSVTNGSHPSDSADVAALESRVAALEAAGPGTGGSEVAALVARVAALEATLAGVSHVDFQGHPTIRFSGVNVQVVDGQDQSTDGGTNGRGNLIIGWNENDGDARTGSHNLVVGPRHSYVSYGGLIAGYDNATTLDYASVTGGNGNVASGRFSSVTGGIDNSASGYYASVTGGNGNTASGYYTAVTGGGDNTANNYYAAVTGGMNNTVTSVGGLVSGGNYNTVSGSFDSVAGGDQVTCNSGKVAVCGEGAFQNTGD